MGCSSSKIEEEAAVQICRDRKDFIKQAIIHRNKFANSHIAYINSLKRVPIALNTCVDEDRYRYFVDSCKNSQLIDDKILFIQSDVRNYSVTVNYSEFATMEDYDDNIEYMDDIFTKDVYWNPFLSIDEERENDEANEMDMAEGENLERESVHEKLIKREERENLEIESHVVGEERENLERETHVVREERENLERESHIVREKRENRVENGGGDLREENLPGFTFHVNRIPTNLTDVMKDLEAQFKQIADVAAEVAVLLEVHIPNQNSSRDRMIPTRRRRNDLYSNENEIQNSNSNGNSDDVSEEPFQLFKSHKSTLERLYTWEKKLHEEVKEGERVRLAYEKKYTQLKNQDILGAEPSTIDKTRATIRDLRTKLNISITSVQSISKRIETLRDTELHPQILALIQGLTKFWRTIGDAHRIQSRAINEAMRLIQLISLSSKSPPPPVSLSSSLASELLNWRNSLSAWLSSQKSYVISLSKWSMSCVADPIHGGPVYDTCVKWMKVVEESIDEEKGLQGIKSFEERVREMVSEGKKRRREREEREREADWRLGFCEGLGEAVGVLERFMARGAGVYEEFARVLNLERSDGRGTDGE